MNAESKLIVMRGHSGSGKSSVAKAIQEQAEKPLVILSHDLFRIAPFKSLKDRSLANELSAEMVVDCASMLLERGFDVIIEGIFYFPKYKSYFDKLFAKHPSNNSVFMFDIDFDETLKRHQTRSKVTDFGVEEMKEWHQELQPSGYDFEKTITNDSTLEETVQFICKIAGIKV
ncbi:MAG TPA: AAA family ATPase [Candidatus Saccharimonadales bacterium]|nr:AAA family ATPase [Candidatus Saccharimonadales bacterium]